MDKYIVLTRPFEMNGFLKKKLITRGKKVYELPAISIEEKQLSDDELDYIRHIATFDWIIFTSANGVNMLMKKLHQYSIKKDAFHGIKVGAIGPATAKAAKENGLEVIFQPSVYISSQIPEEIGDIKGMKILLPRADIASKELAYGLKNKGAHVINIPIYKTIYNLGVDDKFMKLVMHDNIACITFTSSSTVKGFLKRIHPIDIRQVLSIPVVCIGPITAKTARETGFQNISIAKEYRMNGILDILLQMNHE